MKIITDEMLAGERTGQGLPRHGTARNGAAASLVIQELCLA